MRLQTIRAHNYTSLRTTVVEVPDTARVLLIAGANGTGKTALLDGIRAALTGELPRSLRLKKEVPDLITQGEKDGFVGVTVEQDGREAEYTFSLKTGNTSPPPPLADQAFTLFPQAFLELEPAKRRKVLFDRAGISLKPDDVIGVLKNSGHSEARLLKVKTALAGGFAAGQTRAKELVSEARGAWQTVAGETYGSDKGKTWKAEAPVEWDDPAELKKQLDIKKDLVVSTGRLQASLDDDERRHMNSVQEATDAATLEANEAALATLDEQIVAQQVKIDALKNKKAAKGGWTAPCPCCGKILKSEGVAHLIEYVPSDESPAQSGAKLEAARAGMDDLVGRRVGIVKKVDHARACKMMLERLPERPAPDELKTARENHRVAIEEERIANEDWQKAVEQRDLAASAAARTLAAKGHHDDVAAYGLLAEAIEGLPAKYLAKALGAINDSLAESSKAFDQVVQMGEDMELRYGTIRYTLASESQQWRMALALGLALVTDRGGVLQMDRFDMVQPNARGAILAMLAEQDKVQVVLGVTLKAPPKLEADGPIAVYWLGD